jgi:hypothetical protein
VTCRFVSPLQGEGRGFEPLSAHGFRSMINASYSIGGIFVSHHNQPGDARRAPSLEGDGRMRQLKVKKSVKREPARTDPQPIDPRDADVVRAKRRLYEREGRSARRDC